jgi:hypothetical protein
MTSADLERLHKELRDFERLDSTPQHRRRLLRRGISIRPMSGNGMVRPCSGPASKESWHGAPKTRSGLTQETARFQNGGLGKKRSPLVEPGRRRIAADTPVVQNSQRFVIFFL